MKAEKEALEELLAEALKAEAKSMEVKLKSIIKCADIYVPGMSGERADEFFQHIAQIRILALELLPDCGTVSNSDQLTRLKSKFEELWNFAGLLYALKSPERIEAFHAAT